jgi:threonyl-tRNA synthetase
VAGSRDERDRTISIRMRDGQQVTLSFADGVGHLRLASRQTCAHA